MSPISIALTLTIVNGLVINRAHGSIYEFLCSKVNIIQSLGFLDVKCYNESLVPLPETNTTIDQTMHGTETTTTSSTLNKTTTALRDNYTTISEISTNNLISSAITSDSSNTFSPLDTTTSKIITPEWNIDVTDKISTYQTSDEIDSSSTMKSSDSPVNVEISTTLTSDDLSTEHTTADNIAISLSTQHSVIVTSAIKDEFTSEDLNPTTDYTSLGELSTKCIPSDHGELITTSANQVTNSNTEIISTVNLTSDTSILHTTTESNNIGDSFSTMITILDENPSDNSICDESNGLNFQCKQYGRFLDVSVPNCEGYIFCIYTGVNKFSLSRYKCPIGSNFNNITKMCSTLIECPCTFNKTESYISTTPTFSSHVNSTESLETITSEIINNKNYTTIIETTTSPLYTISENDAMTTSHNDKSAITNKSASDNSNCDLTIGLNFECKQHGRFLDVSVPNCEGYIFCVNTGLGFTLIRYKCPDGSFFNNDTKMCRTFVQCPCISNDVKVTTREQTTPLNENSTHIIEMLTTKIYNDSAITEKYPINITLTTVSKTTITEFNTDLINPDTISTKTETESSESYEHSSSIPHDIDDHGNISGISTIIPTLEESTINIESEIMSSTFGSESTFTFPDIVTNSPEPGHSILTTNMQEDITQTNDKTNQPATITTAINSIFPESNCIINSTKHSFECKSMGRFQDKEALNCQGFLYCVLLSNGSYALTKYTCPSGTLFNPSSSMCTSDYVCPCEIITSTTIKLASTPGIEINNVTSMFNSTTLQDNKTNLITIETDTTFEPILIETTTPINTCNSKTVKECTTTGRFPDHSQGNCKSYIYCVVINGKITRKSYTCPSVYIFDPVTERCTDASLYSCPC